jgi:heme/copper-type cytochrome/quinol oxidase subunit 3
LPLVNTVILLSSGVSITYAHHSLIQGNRRGSLYGGLLTILLAILFTGFQGLEYTVSSFTITDSVYGSCFFFGTGFHGLILIVALFLCIFIPMFKINIMNNIKSSDKLLIIVPSYRDKESHTFYLNKSFLE